MKRKEKEKKGNSGRIVLRILKDSLGIWYWLLLATALSIGSAYLAMNAPEILGDLTNQIYDLADKGTTIDMTVFYKRILTLAIVYLLSAAFGALTTAVMDYSVSNFFTCKLRIRMSEKIAKIPIKSGKYICKAKFR